MKNLELTKKTNVRNQVVSHIDFLKSFNKFDGKFSTVKSIIKMMIEKENKSISEMKIRSSNEFKDAYTNAIYN